MAELTINGVDIADLGLTTLAPFGDAWSIPETSRETAAVLGRVGVVPSEVATAGAKTITLTWLLTAATPSVRRALLDTVLWQLDGVLRLVWSDSTDRVQYARVDSARISALFDEAAFTIGDLRLPIDFILDTPMAFDIVPQMVAWAAGTQVAVPVGLETSGPLLTFPGIIASTVVITYYHGLTNTAIGTALTILDPTLGTDDALVIDCANERIYTSTAGAALVDAPELYSSGDFPVFDPSDGDPNNSIYPQIGSDEAGMAQWRRAW